MAFFSSFRQKKTSVELFPAAVIYITHFISQFWLNDEFQSIDSDIDIVDIQFNSSGSKFNDIYTTIYKINGL